MALTDVNSTLKNIVTNLSQLITGFNSYNAAIVTQLMKISPVGPGIPLIPASFISPGVFVETTGNDSTGDGSSGAPWLTIQHAFDQILTYDFNGNVLVTINVGAGSFAGFSVIGPARGWTGDQQTGAGSSILVLGAGSGSTNIGPMTSNAALCIGASAAIHVQLKAINTNVPGTGGAGINNNTWALISFVTDVSFTGGGDGTGTAILCDAFGFVSNHGAVTLKGTLDTYYNGFNTANYEGDVGNSSVAIAGALSQFASLGVLSNMHDETVSLSGGSVTGNAYTVDGNSILSMATSLVPAIWSGASTSSGGILSNGGRSEGACDVPSINSATGLGSGSAAMKSDGTAYAVRIVLSPAGSPSNAGNVVVQINELALIPGGSSGSFTATLLGGTGTWDTRSIVTITSLVGNATNVVITIAWDNNGVSLTAGDTYQMNLSCNT